MMVRGQNTPLAGLRDSFRLSMPVGAEMDQRWARDGPEMDQGWAIGCFYFT